MPLRNAVEPQDSDSLYATVLELREEHQFLRKRKSGSPGGNTQEDAVVALIDYHRARLRAMTPSDLAPASGTRRRTP
ncbi:MAG TPA: hypothetical protein VN397_01450 [Candidatus Methylomirabilis sp.]|nr:hypothetical protein [Candidatus Methylomirabilis sp.]